MRKYFLYIERNTYFMITIRYIHEMQNNLIDVELIHILLH